MRLLLDTHVFVWLATKRRSLTHRERTAIENASELILSSISLWELRAKVRAERRRLYKDLTIDPAGAIAFCKEAGIRIDQVTIADTVLPLDVDPPHGDPFDEMIVLHAQRLGALLLTRDEDLENHPLAYP